MMKFSSMLSKPLFLTLTSNDGLIGISISSSTSSRGGEAPGLFGSNFFLRKENLESGGPTLWHLLFFLWLRLSACTYKAWLYATRASLLTFLGRNAQIRYSWISTPPKDVAIGTQFLEWYSQVYPWCRPLFQLLWAYRHARGLFWVETFNQSKKSSKIVKKYFPTHSYIQFMAIVPPFQISSNIQIVVFYYSSDYIWRTIVNFRVKYWRK